MRLLRNARPLTVAEVVVYLDFDGVLHHEAVMLHPRRGVFMDPVEAPGRALFEWAHFLEAELAPFPDVRLVLSSSWCVQVGYRRAIRNLSPALQDRFIGGTFHKRHHTAEPGGLYEFQASTRWQQILADVARRRPGAWLALDDDVAGWPAQHSRNLVACEGSTGLSSEAVRAELRNKLHQLVRPNPRAT